MKQAELVYREILYRNIEKKEKRFTQSELSKKLGVSLSIVNSAVKNLQRIGAIKINQRNFDVFDTKKILYFWASARNLEKDIIFKIRIDAPVREIERIMPNVIFTAYTAYKLKFKDVPADYSEVYIYADELQTEEIKKRIKNFKTSGINPNFFILKKDSVLGIYKKLPLSQLFVDLWNLREWYAKDFLESLNKTLSLSNE